MNNLLIRVDADPVMGTGHWMRCLALAQGWTTFGGQVTFLTREGSLFLKHTLDPEIKLAVLVGEDDAKETITLAKKLNASWIVADGYHFDHEFQRQLKESGRKLMVMDDYGHASHYYADVVLNSN